MMYIQKNNSSNLRYSKMRSNTAALLPKKKVTIPKSSPIKPSCVSKRSVSLPPNLRKNTVKTKNLFWFIPKAEDSRKRRLAEQRPPPIVASGAPEIPDLDAECQKVLQQQQKIPESVALNWITSSSTHSLSDSSDTSGEPMDDDDDDDLFGLEFLDTSTETDNKHC